MTQRVSGAVPIVFLALAAALGGCGSSGGGDSAKNWVGKTYLIDTPGLDRSFWVQPKGFGADIGGYVPQFLIGVAAGTGNDLTITLATTLGPPNQNVSPGLQDTCAPTTQVVASGASYPDIDIVAPLFPMRVYDSNKSVYVNATAHDLTLKNVLPGNKDIATAALIATVDVRDLYSLFYLIPNATPDSVCATFQSQGVPCESCTSDQKPYCLTLKAVQVSATAAPNPIQAVTSPTCP